MRSRALLAVTWAIVAGCTRSRPRPAPGTPEDLAATLRVLAGADDATRQRAAATWLVDEALWERTIVPPFRGLYAGYRAGFPTAIEPVVAALASSGTVTARLHYAGDAKLTRAQQRTRWALPTLFPSAVAELDGKPLDAVFVYDGTRWHALAGLDELVLGHVRTADPACAVRLALAGPLGSCTDVGYAIAAAALQADHDALARACALAVTLCANESP